MVVPPISNRDLFELPLFVPDRRYNSYVLIVDDKYRYITVSN